MLLLYIDHKLSVKLLLLVQTCLLVSHTFACFRDTPFANHSLFMLFVYSSLLAYFSLLLLLNYIYNSL